jgi:HSP20 family protein
MHMETNSPNGGRQTEAARGRPGQTPETGETQAQQPGGAERQQSLRTGGSETGQDRSRAMESRRRSDPRRSATQYQPLNTMMRLSREMDQLFDSFFGNRLGASRLLRRWPFEAGGESGNEMSSLWTPSVDVRQRGDSILIHAELPGVPKEAVRIEATDEGIAISGERSESRDENDTERGYQLQERTYGSFYRNIPLPEGAQVEEAKATMREGVLEVTVPVQQGGSRRQIQIE